MISTKNFIPLLRFPGIRQLTAVNMSISQQKKNHSKMSSVTQVSKMLLLRH
uniref:Uncharacterized protein n=1 Tax=Zea mays TaxID=4577 RepID=C0PLJ4_MAIZE|nr:unknown [Zea mays]